MDQDANNGNIYLEAPKRIHERVADFLGNLNPGDSFKIFPLVNLTASDAQSTIEELLGIGGFEAPEGSPRIVADSDLQQLLVYGTPTQILQIEKMVQQLDSAVTATDSVRRPVRIIPMSPRRQEEVMEVLQIEGFLELKGRKNVLNVIMPDNRNRPRSGIRMELPRNSAPNTQPESEGNERGSGTTTSLFQPPSQFYVTEYREPQENEAPNEAPNETEDDENVEGNSQAPFDSSAAPVGATRGSEYIPADEIPSVPGAPIEVRMTDQGLIVKSYDLDAADDLTALIEELFDPSSEWQRPTVIPLEHRDVEEAKSILNYFLGLESDSGGGGGGLAGGIGNLLGGAVQNAVGGAAGDALGGLFGGGDSFGGSSSSSAGAIELEGEDVRIATDVRFNTLIVTGATGNDIDVILELVEYLDQPGPPQKPKTLGQTYEIPIRYRDPMEIKELVQAQLPDDFRQSASAAGGNQQDPRQQIQQQIAQQLQAAMQGGNRGRRGGRGGKKVRHLGGGARDIVA